MVLYHIYDLQYQHLVSDVYVEHLQKDHLKEMLLQYSNIYYYRTNHKFGEIGTEHGYKVLSNYNNIDCLNVCLVR